MLIRLNLDSRPNKDGLHAVKVCIYQSRTKRKSVSLGYHIKFQQFDFKNRRVKRINRQADEIHQKFEEIKNDILNQYGISEIKKRHLNDNFSFSYLSDEYINYLMKSPVSFNTVQNYYATFKNIEAYCKDFDVNSITHDFVKSFVRFCNRKPIGDGKFKTLASTTVNSYLSRLNTFYAWLSKTHGVRPVGDLFMELKESEKAAKNRVPRYYAPELILEFFNKMRSYSILRHDFSKNQYLAAASWLLMYFSFGMRVGDLYRLKFRAFREVNNKLVIAYKASKTLKETHDIILKDKAIFMLRLFLPSKYLWEYLMAYPEDYIAWWCYNGTKKVLTGTESLFGNDQIGYTAEQIRFIRLLILEQAMDYGEQYVIPNIPADLNLLPRMLVEQRINERRNTNHKALKKMLKLLELPPISFHGSRHSFACKIINQNDVKPIDLQVALNHSDLSTTNNYIAQFDVERSRERIAEIVNAD